MGVAPAVVEGVSGAAGGIAALLTTYPLMTISTLQATRSKQVRRLACIQAACCLHRGMGSLHAGCIVLEQARTSISCFVVSGRLERCWTLLTAKMARPPSRESVLTSATA